MPEQEQKTYTVCKFYNESCQCIGCKGTKLSDSVRKLRGMLASALQGQAEQEHFDVVEQGRRSDRGCKFPKGGQA